MSLCVVFIYLLMLKFCSAKSYVEDRFSGDNYCKTPSSLIRLEKVGEVTVVDTPLQSTFLLQCKFCNEIGLKSPKLWYRQEIETGENTEINFSESGPKEKRHVVLTPQHSLINHNVSLDDSGLYYCRFPYEDSLDNSFNYLVDPVVEPIPPVVGNMTSWRNYADEFLIPVNKALEMVYMLNGTKIELYLEVFSAWSPWSECEVCKKNPVHSRTGHCRVRPICLVDTCTNLLANKQTTGEAAIIELLLRTSTALSCRGHLLQTYLPSAAEAVSNISDFVHTKPCPYSCSLRGGSMGPKERRLIYLFEGENQLISCTGTKERNSKIIWKYNKQIINPATWNTQESHILVDHFGILHLVDVTMGLKGTYVCYLNKVAQLEVHVEVHRRLAFIGKVFIRHFIYLLMIIFLCFFIFCMRIIVVCIKINCCKNFKTNSNEETEALLPLSAQRDMDYYSDREQEEETESDVFVEALDIISEEESVRKD